MLNSVTQILSANFLQLFELGKFCWSGELQAATMPRSRERLDTACNIVFLRGLQLICDSLGEVPNLPLQTLCGTILDLLVDCPNNAGQQPVLCLQSRLKSGSQKRRRETLSHSMMTLMDTGTAKMKQGDQKNHTWNSIKACRYEGDVLEHIRDLMSTNMACINKFIDGVST